MAKARLLLAYTSSRRNTTHALIDVIAMHRFVLENARSWLGFSHIMECSTGNSRIDNRRQCSCSYMCNRAVAKPTSFNWATARKRVVLRHGTVALTLVKQTKLKQ
ncbi:hypothetical protein F2P81_001351 [Scophthalmus maximus]|uniref:Uncharacterized protein n=1 Tax=Scophthalmus maximus TaxID=52904 RepID=A0A6A4TTP4_SCOMX|nr:hypothetical protein F2P81_001351 [Scophthalmus maximus]